MTRDGEWFRGAPRELYEENHGNPVGDSMVWGFCSDSFLENETQSVTVRFF